MWQKTVKTTRLESHSSLVDSFGWAAVIRACASATRWRRALVAWQNVGVTGHVENYRCIFSPNFSSDDVFTGSFKLVQCKSVDGGWMFMRVSISQNCDLISKELLFVARFLADQSKIVKRIQEGAEVEDV